MLGAPHAECPSQNGSRAFAEGKVERIRLIDFIEEALGRKLTMEEAVDEMENLLDKLREIAVMR